MISGVLYEGTTCACKREDWNPGICTLHTKNVWQLASTYLDMMAGAAVSADAFDGRGILNAVIAMMHMSGKTGGRTHAWEGGD